MPSNAKAGVYEVSFSCHAWALTSYRFCLNGKPIEEPTFEYYRVPSASPQMFLSFAPRVTYAPTPPKVTFVFWAQITGCATVTKA